MEVAHNVHGVQRRPQHAQRPLPPLPPPTPHCLMAPITTVRQGNPYHVRDIDTAATATQQVQRFAKIFSVEIMQELRKVNQSIASLERSVKTISERQVKMSEVLEELKTFMVQSERNNFTIKGSIYEVS